MNDRTKPRLCLLIGAFHPIVGGGETQMRLLTSALQQRGIECRVITQRRPSDAPSRSIVDGVDVHRVWPRGRDRAGKYLMMLPAFTKLVSLRSRYDVILVSGIRTLGQVGVAAGAMLGKRVILRMASRDEMSGGYIGGGKGDWRRRLATPIVRWRNRTLCRADRFVAVSRAIRMEYLECGVPETRIVDLPNGTDIDRFRPVNPEVRPALRSRLGLPADRHLFVYTGKLNRGKGLPMLLRAWNRLAAERSDLGLVLVGGGANQALSCEVELRAFVAAHHLEQSVSFAGYQEDVLPYLQAADIFVLPSDSEAMPNSLVEAMACGLPCIATAVGGVLDIVDDGVNGLLLPVGDEKRLAELMETLVADPERAARLGRNARADAMIRYDRRHNVERFVAMLDEIDMRRPGL